MRWILREIDIFACGKSTRKYITKQCNKLKKYANPLKPTAGTAQIISNDPQKNI